MYRKVQESMLFNRTVKENIALAEPTMPMDRVIAAASLAVSPLVKYKHEVMRER